jgi:sugar transferase EpsL
LLKEVQAKSRLRVKRWFDFLVATVLLVVLSPLFAALALLVWLCMGRPVLFQQLRPGLHGEPFMVQKFRTMNSRRDAQGNLLSDGERLTRLGQFLRRASLDELPQLWNVWTGAMSLVGPRPLLMEYMERYNPEQARRHELRPGITGWAQVNGRNLLSWAERFELDVWYVDHWTLALDGKILLLTLQKLLLRKGISQSGHATMPKFLGNTQAR